MDSKMRPLWLVWENYDAFGEDVYLMYKRGDGRLTYIDETLYFHAQN